MKMKKIALLSLVPVALILASSMASTAAACETGFTPGFWKHNIGVYLGENPGKYSAFPDGTKLTPALLDVYAATVSILLSDAYAALTAKGPGMDTVRADMANAFNAAAGYGPFND